MKMTTHVPYSASQTSQRNPEQSAVADPTHLRFEMDSTHVGILTFDRSNSNANVFDRETLEQLDAYLTMIGHDRELRGLVITSAKPSIFIAGADLHSLSQAGPEEVAALIDLGQRVFEKLAFLSVQLRVVAAIHGACVGGGYELALACGYRIATADKATRIGLPETQLGILPAWGGSTRLPRLIGLPKALEVILGGKTFPAPAALKKGLIDEVVPKETLMSQAMRRVLEQAEAIRGHPMSPVQRLFGFRPMSKWVARKARMEILKKTQGLYPAPLKAVEVVEASLQGTIVDSLKRERSAVLELLGSSECRRLVDLFFLQERAKKLQYLAGGEMSGVVEPLQRAYVLGAGVMGAGIAQWLSSRGIHTTLKDVNADCLARGIQSIRGVYEDAVRRRTLTAVEAKKGLDCIIPVTQEVPLRMIDLVIEAAVEKMEVKKEIFRHLAEVTGPETILATNTSALSIGELADATSAPERVLGLHFFNPVHRMQLVEVVVGPKTEASQVRRAVKWVQNMGKLPVVVKDRPGFLVNRILMPYLMEAGRLFQEGATVADLDRCMLEFGMPMGPMRLLDEVGIDVAMHVAKTLVEGLDAMGTIPPVFQEMLEQGWLGKKSGRGFYVYESGKTAEHPRTNPKAVALQRGSRALDLDLLKMRERLVLAMVNESARCLEEGVVADACDVDFAMVMGTGFAPFRGGPLHHAEDVGLARVLEMLQRLVEEGGSQFEPCDLLKAKVAAGTGFYPAEERRERKI